MTTIKKLEDLITQATTERSHHYVAATCRQAIEEIKTLMLGFAGLAELAANEIQRLKLQIEQLSEYKAMYQGLCK